MTGYNFKGSRVNGTVKDRNVESSFNTAWMMQPVNYCWSAGGESGEGLFSFGGSGCGGKYAFYGPVRTTSKDSFGATVKIEYIGPGVTPYEFAVKNGYKVFGSSDNFKAYRGRRCVMEYGYDN